MSSIAQRPNRRSHRYKGYDYSAAGAYFVTACIRDGQALLGDIVDQEMHANRAGLAVEECWHRLPERFSDIELDAFQVMPNHVHGIIWLRSLDGAAGAASSAPTLGQVMRFLMILFAPSDAVSEHQNQSWTFRVWRTSSTRRSSATAAACPCAWPSPWQRIWSRGLDWYDVLTVAAFAAIVENRHIIA